MEIANTKQQKECASDTETLDQDPKVKVPHVPVCEEDEINALYQSVPEVANHFIITNKIGEGAFSCVYLARLKHYPEVSELFALKYILPTTHPARIENELRCLLKLGGQDNVMGVKLCMRHRDNVVIVMEYFPHEKFQDCLNLLSVEEARNYMKHLLISLRRVHQHEVIHRDIKPSNFLYDREKKRYALVDFGLASGSFLIDRDGEKMFQRNGSASKRKINNPSPRVPLSPSKLNIPHSKKVSPSVNKIEGKPTQSLSLGKTPSPFCVPLGCGKAYVDKSGLCNCLGKPQICSLCVARKNQLAPRAGTAGFRAPEVLLKSPSQDTSIDIWSAGTIFLSILSSRYPFFRAQDDMGYLSQIISVVGSSKCVEAASSFGKILTLSEVLPPVDLMSACLKLRMSQMAACFNVSSSGSSTSDAGTESSEPHQLLSTWHDISPDAFDLLARMLDPNPATRITAEEALKHSFFVEC